jgi:hypothetical protein
MEFPVTVEPAALLPWPAMSLATSDSQSIVDPTLCAQCSGGRGITRRLTSRPDGGMLTYQTCDACGVSWVLAVSRRDGAYVVERLATCDGA